MKITALVTLIAAAFSTCGLTHADDSYSKKYNLIVEKNSILKSDDGVYSATWRSLVLPGMSLYTTNKSIIDCNNFSIRTYFTQEIDPRIDDRWQAKPIENTNADANYASFSGLNGRVIRIVCGYADQHKMDKYEPTPCDSKKVTLRALCSQDEDVAGELRLLHDRAILISKECNIPEDNLLSILARSLLRAEKCNDDACILNSALYTRGIEVYDDKEKQCNNSKEQILSIKKEQDEDEKSNKFVVYFRACIQSQAKALDDGFSDAANIADATVFKCSSMIPPELSGNEGVAEIQSALKKFATGAVLENRASQKKHKAKH